MLSLLTGIEYGGSLQISPNANGAGPAKNSAPPTNQEPRMSQTAAQIQSNADHAAVHEALYDEAMLHLDAAAVLRHRELVVELQEAIDDIEQPEESLEEQGGSYFEHLLISATQAAGEGSGSKCLHYIRCALGEILHEGDIDAIEYTLDNCEARLGYTLDLDADVEPIGLEDIPNFS